MFFWVWSFGEFFIANFQQKFVLKYPMSHLPEAIALFLNTQCIMEDKEPHKRGAGGGNKQKSGRKRYEIGKPEINKLKYNSQKLYTYV